MARKEPPLPRPSRVLYATLAALAGAIPTVLTAPEDRAIALGLPAIALALGTLLQRMADRRRATTVDAVCAALLACPGLAAHGWLRLRALDASAWYVPEQQVLGILEQAGKGGATTGILWGGAAALALLRGPHARPFVVAMLTAGLWIGLGSLAVHTLRAQLYLEPSPALLYLTALTSEWVAGAILGGLVGWWADRTPSSRRATGLSVATGMVLTAVCTVPVHLLAETLPLPPLSGPLPSVPVGPRTTAPVYMPAGAASPEDLAQQLLAAGHPRSPREWTPQDYPRAPWHRGLRMGVVVVLPPDSPRSGLDQLADAARGHNTFRLSLPGRTSSAPPGLLGALFAHPTVDLLLDPAPSDAVWGTVHATGDITWDRAPPTSTPAPSCSLRADPDVTVGTLTEVAFALSSRTAPVRCRGIGYPHAACHPGGAGSPHCPPSP